MRPVWFAHVGRYALWFVVGFGGAACLDSVLARGWFGGGFSRVGVGASIDWEAGFQATLPAALRTWEMELTACTTWTAGVPGRIEGADALEAATAKLAADVKRAGDQLVAEGREEEAAVYGRRAQVYQRQLQQMGGRSARAREALRTLKRLCGEQAALLELLRDAPVGVATAQSLESVRRARDLAEAMQAQGSELRAALAEPSPQVGGEAGASR